MGQLMAVPLTKLLNYVETLYEAHRRGRICSEVIKLLTRDFRQQTDDYRGLNTFMQPSKQAFNSFIKFISIQGGRQCRSRSLFRAEAVIVFVQSFVPALFIPGSSMGCYCIWKGMKIRSGNVLKRYKIPIGFVHLLSVVNEGLGKDQELIILQ